MDILAGVFAYVAGIGALFAGLALSFFVLFSSPNATIEPQSPPQSATAMLVKQATPNKAPAAEANAKPLAAHPEKQAAVASPEPAQQTMPGKLSRHKASASTARLRRMVQEERARRWAYQQDSSFESRFLGYAD